MTASVLKHLQVLNLRSAITCFLLSAIIGIATNWESESVGSMFIAACTLLTGWWILGVIERRHHD